MHKFTPVAACLLITSIPAFAAASCEGLQALTLPDTTITRAESVAAGEFKMPEGALRPGQPATNLSRMPGFCRVSATLAPSRDSAIKVTDRLPASQTKKKKKKKKKNN